MATTSKLSKSDAKAVQAAGVAGGLTNSQAKAVVSKTNAGTSAPTPSYTAGNTKTTASGVTTALPDRASGPGAPPVAPQETPTEALGPEIAPATTPAPATQGISTITDPVTGQQFTRDINNPNSVYQKKQAQLSQMQGVGEAPSEGGVAKMGMQQNLAQEQDTTMPDSIVTGDAGMQQLFKGVTDLMNAQNQSSTLMQDYKKLYKQSGLDEINEELIDADTVINGTEDDIRNEIQTAGGFGTDSQVQAMALSRNKGLLKRYNQLVQMKTDATNQLNTLTSLNAQDKQIAQQRVNTQISTMFNMANFAQQAQNNVREQARWLTQTMGADGIYNAYKGDPRQLAFLEKTLGIAPGGLKTVAAQAAQERSLDNRYKQAQIDKIKSDIDGAKSGANADPADVIAYAQQYASTGQIPTGLKGAGVNFGLVSQVAKELPKPTGTLVDRNTGVKSNSISSTQVDGITALYDISNKVKELKELDKDRWGGLVSGTLGWLLGSGNQAKYLSVRGEIVDLLSRARTGAALTKSEEDFYAGQLPGRWDEPLGIGADSDLRIDNFDKKINESLQTKLNINGAAIYGYSPIDIGGEDFIVGDVIQNEAGQYGRINADGSITIIQE